LVLLQAGERLLAIVNAAGRWTANRPLLLELIGTRMEVSGIPRFASTQLLEAERCRAAGA